MTNIRVALVLSTALIVPVAGHAQSIDTACADLENFVVAGLPAELGDTDELMEIATAADGAVCLVEVERIVAANAEMDGATVVDTAETTLRLMDEVTVAGRVLLDQSAPQVAVTEGETDVEVEPGAAEVTVSNQAAQIVVRQQAANITVDMPTPTIRIEQPAPEIIITMPDPSIAVASAQPTVRVVQGDPRVSVTQAPPGVELELAPVAEGEEGGFDVSDARTGQSYRSGMAPEAVTTEDAEVTVTKSEPRVLLTESPSEPMVEIVRAEPNVTFEQADPVVQFSQMGEPQIELVQTGEPIITFEQAALADDAPMTDTAALAADGTAMPAAPLTDDATVSADTGLQVADPAATGMAMEQPMIEREGYTMAAAGDYEVSTLEGANLYGVDDEVIGEIGSAVLADDGTVTDITVEIGGFLGLGEKEVLLPFERLSVLSSETDDLRVYIEASEEELEAMPAYQ